MDNGLWGGSGGEFRGVGEMMETTVQEAMLYGGLIKIDCKSSDMLID
jgi:hypothetical protein